jgi:hypothetical protein
MAHELYSDHERLGLAAYWADDAASKLVAARGCGLICGTTREGQEMLDTLYDGLLTLAENLNALALPYPPPVVPPPRGLHLRVVK